MPYITPDIREDLDSGRNAPATPGSLNYVITKMVDDYVGTHGLSYATINDVIGVFECAKAEFYRRVNKELTARGRKVFDGALADERAARFYDRDERAARDRASRQPAHEYYAKLGLIYRG